MSAAASVIYCPCSGHSTGGGGGEWRADVPRVGWTYRGFEDLGEADFTCEMCGNHSIRYVHRVYHADIAAEHPNGLGVGCVCASKMTRQAAIAGFPVAAGDDFDTATKRSTTLAARLRDADHWKNTAKGGWRCTIRNNGAICATPRGNGIYLSHMQPSTTKEKTFVPIGTLEAVTAPYDHRAVGAVLQFMGLPLLMN